MAKLKNSTENKKNIFDYLRSGESYSSLILGMIVVIISTSLLLYFVNGQNRTTANSVNAENTQNSVGIVQRVTNFFQPNEKTENENTKEARATQDEKTNVYKVAAGDTLWTIAEKEYKNGYKWVEIARVNNLSNPDVVVVGAELELPKINPEPVVANNKADSDKALNVNTSGSKITGETYKIAAGDTLWDIAIRAHGDGYKWTDIARVNNLSNPDLIYAGNTLKIPRS